MKYKITAKDEVKNTITVAFLKDDASVFKTVTMQARPFLPVDDAVALDAELAKQAEAMAHEVTEVAVGAPYDTKIALNTVKDSKVVLEAEVVIK